MSEYLSVKHRPRFFCTIHSAAMNRAGITRNDVFSDWKGLEKETRLKFTGQGFAAAVDSLGSEPNRNGDHILILKNFASSNMISIEQAREQLPKYPVLTKVNIARTLRIFDEFKKAKGQFDFDDMLNIYNEDREASPLPVDIVFVDEAQDLSKLQWSVVHKLAGQSRKMFIVGDDDQAVYTFLGADPYGFLDHNADETIVLDRSWRCPSSIGEFADTIINKVSKRQDKEFAWKDAPGVLRYHQGDPWPLLRDAEDTMFLCRHRKQCFTLTRILSDKGIPHSLNGESIFHGRRAERLRQFIRLAIGDEVPIGKAADAISLVPNQRNRLEKMRKRARSEPGLKVKKDDIGLNWTIPWYNLAARHTREVTENLIIRRHLTRHGTGVLGRKPAIDISTIHAAKGREAKDVILATDCFPAVWEEQNRTMESELRLAYVGVTRAKERLTIIRPKTNMHLRALV